MTIDEIKSAASDVAAAMKGADPIPPAVRERFITVRAALFQRGVYDPLLVRFDSYTVTKASAAEIAERLTEVAASL
jgi:hypothetical protein